MPGTAEQAKLLEKDQGIACHEGWSEKNGICSDISYGGRKSCKYLGEEDFF